MEISSKYVGVTLKEYNVEISWRDTMNFAAALGDNNPAYFDDERDGGIIAPPMMAVAITWPISERIWEYIEADDFPTELLMTQVHYTERLRFHRPVRPGDKLSVKGVIAAILPHRAGSHVVIRFDASDAKGEPVFTEHIGAMLRGVKCMDDGRGASDLPDTPRGESGQTPIWEETFHVDPLLPFIYDGCTKIFFPIHTSKRFARGVGLPGIILQGTATLGIAARAITDRAAAADPARLKEIFCRFTGMVLPGSDVSVRLEAQEKRAGGEDLFFSVAASKAKPALSNGYARIE